MYFPNPNQNVKHINSKQHTSELVKYTFVENPYEI
jgi:hypothetical protein